MTDRWTRPEPQKIVAAYDRLFRSNSPLSKLKDAAFTGRLFSDSAEQDGLGVEGRSLAWKLFLISTVPLTPPASQSPAMPPIGSLKERRRDYTSLLLEKMRAPDGSYEEGFSIPGVDELPRPNDEANMNLQRNNPLSLHEDNPWKEWFAAVDLRKTIRQDVERTFPDHDYFRIPEVQSQLTNILYIYSVTHPDIGYRQGMHELLAPLFHAADYDSVTPSEDTDPELAEFCSRIWVSADAWVLFSTVMDGVSTWYEWREPTPPPIPSPLQNQYRHGPPEGQLELKPYVAPIVLACQKLQSQMLKTADPLLWQGMQKAGIEPQIYGIRWLRLLFTREFNLPDAMTLWDGIFSYDDTFELVPWICVAMLIRIRNQLIPADYSGQLTFLLRYPPPPADIDQSSPHHAVLLLRQAFALHSSPNPSTGSSIAMENRNLLNIPLEVPEPVQSRVRTRRPAMRVRSSTDIRKAGQSSSSFQPNKRPSQQSQSVQLGFPELLARGLLEKSESLGINKTVMNAVSELRKNIPDLANQLIGSPSNEGTGYSSFPLVTERPPEERPPWEHRTRFEMEREIATLRALQKKMGDAVGFAVDALLQDEGEDPETVKRVRNRKREAVESLALVRDLLKGATTEIDEERLYGEEEYKKRQEIPPSRGSETSTSSSPPPRPPEPAVAAPRPSIEHRRQKSSPPAQSVPSHPIVSLPRIPLITQPQPEQVSMKRVTHASTLPRQRSGSSQSNPTLESDSFRAPWNYTKSNFSTPALNSTTLPRPPPRTSQSPVSMRSQVDNSPYTNQIPVRQVRKTSDDPLGALSS